MSATTCWIATPIEKEKRVKINPFPTVKSVSPFVPNVGDRVALLGNLEEHGRLAVASGRQGRVVSRTCGVYEVQFDHEAPLRVRHVFQDALTVLRRRLRAEKVA